MPGIDKKLVSAAALTARGVLVQFKRDQAVLISDDVIVAVIKRVRKLFALNVKQCITLEAHKTESGGAINDTSELWHARIGHVSTKTIMQAMKSCDGILRVVASDGGVSDGCARGKMTNIPFSHTSGSEVKTSRPLKFVHTNLMGPMSPKSNGGALNVLTFIDDYSQFVYVYLLAAKSQVYERFEGISCYGGKEKQTDCKIKCIRSDNGGEYTNRRFNKYCADLGIIHQRSVPYIFQQNGLAERMNRTLVEMARSMIYHMEVDRYWWGEAIMAAAYTINRIPNTARPNASPFESLYGSKPDLSHFLVFDSTGYLRVADCKRTKWDIKANMCIFLGYSENSKAYRVCDIARGQLVTTRSFTRNESPLSRYKNVVVLSEPLAQCNHYHDDLDEVKVGVPDLNKNHDDDEMGVIDIADIDTSWEDMVVDASGHLNQSQNLDVVPIEVERTDIQVIDTNNSMIRRTSHGSVAGSSNNGTHMLSGIPDQSRAIICHS
ncbi:hypothetical protein DD238_007958 [Peronospora effusa]|uniref:Integrase catalytic domain-containing protein n=1 Tax=Peronospora effusa TaxID=542832 RepID=A0A3M6VBH5_9STRA|nr:hypothetical protein DD238_007958 [Peronospora effusa]RQM11473.1 hypothetical protein DD237_008136 [Peronospora effusa]